MLDEKKIRAIFREEIRRYAPEFRTTKRTQTVPQVMRQYGRGHAFILELIRTRELAATLMPSGKNGKPQYLVEIESARRHPLLGGGL